MRCRKEPSRVYPNPSGDGSFVVELTRGYVAVVDEGDVDVVSGHYWRVILVPRSRTPYADLSGVRMHRMILNVPVGMQVDHIDGDGLNNRRSNLRVVDGKNNCRNRRIGRANTSGFKGVTWNKDSAKWQAGIQVNGRSIHLGLHDDLVSAALAYDAAARESFGEFACVNFPVGNEQGARAA